MMDKPSQAPKVDPEAYLELLGDGPWNNSELVPTGPQKRGPEGSGGEHSGRDHCRFG